MNVYFQLQQLRKNVRTYTVSMYQALMYMYMLCTSQMHICIYSIHTYMYVHCTHICMQYLYMCGLLVIGTCCGIYSCTDTRPPYMCMCVLASGQRWHTYLT